MNPWKWPFRLVGIALLTASCSADHSDLDVATADLASPHPILLRMQQLVDTNQVSDLNAVAQLFGGREWKPTPAQRETLCETALSDGGTISFAISWKNVPKENCSIYTQGHAVYDQESSYFLRLSLLNTPCLTFSTLRVAAARPGWRFESLRAQLGGNPNIYHNAALRWTGPATVPGTPNGGIVVVFEDVNERDPDLEAKLMAADRCATGSFLLSYRVRDAP